MICPLGNDVSRDRRRADDVLQYVITPVAEAEGFSTRRSDLEPTPGRITPQILQGILGAAVIVADVTGRNANVFYELAVAESFAKPVILLADTAETLPFDVRDDRVIEIPDDNGAIPYRDGEEAKKRFAEALKVVTAEGYVADSLLRGIAATAALAQFAPTEAIAAGLAAIRATVETFSRRLPRTPARGAQARAEHGILMRMVEELMQQGYVTMAGIGWLWEFETSPEFGVWLRALMSGHPELFHGPSE